jgi:chorismate mutase/prephenate dehydratase
MTDMQSNEPVSADGAAPQDGYQPVGTASRNNPASVESDTAGDLASYRAEIDRIDDDILSLFTERMDVASLVAAYKKAHNMPVMDRSREREILAQAADRAPEDMTTYAQVLMGLLMEASRNRQNRLTKTESPIVDAIDDALAKSPDLFPATAYIGCQGVEGAFQQIAADRLFKHPAITYFSTFESVFRAVEEGLCDYGVLPVENSTAGSVNQVYDLMMDHNFYVVRTCRLKIDHNLLAKHGTKLDDVTDIYSHEQAISQCEDWIAAHPGIKVHIVENTATAAKMVAESPEKGVAALAARSAAELYGLDTLERSVQDNANNYTRFACIAKDLTIFPGADRTSLMIVADHQPGALYKILAKFYALDINIIKLESRPIPGRDFEFMFYFDLECPVKAPGFKTLMASLPEVCEEVRYLGSYSEIV